MKFLPFLALLSLTTAVFADEYVPGYVKKDGTVVSGYYRSSPNNTVRDNFSYKGNQNPYTGATGTNTYPNSPSSGYYNGIGTPGFGSGSGFQPRR